MVHRGSVRVRRVTAVLILVGVVLVGFIVVDSVIEHKTYSGSVLPGVRVDGVRVAGKKQVAALDEITRTAIELERAPIRARAGTAHFTVEPSLIDYTVDAEATATAARRAGREGNPLAIVAGTVLRRIRSDDVPLVVHYDSERLEGLLDAWATRVDSGLVEGDLRFAGTTVIPVEPKAGTGLLREPARAALEDALEHAHRAAEVELPIGETTPRVDHDQVELAAARARNLLAEGVELDAGPSRLVLAPAQLAATLGTRIDGHTLALTIDTTKLHKALESFLDGYEQPPVDATFAISSSNTVSVVPSRDGMVVDLDAVARDILGGKRVIAVQRAPKHPAHDTAWARALGITKQVSSFTTRHPAGQPRVHNIHLGADGLDGAVVEPGATFSLNDRLGRRTPEKGYVKAPILVEDGFGEDYGGGVSQLATTLYNAVFWGGYEDVEHSPHHFYITRYPMGREATVNYPSVDVKFRDDTAHGVLIRATYSDTSVTVTFYGDNEGREVEEENRKILATVPITDELVPCPVHRPQDDPNGRCASLSPLEHELAVDGETGYDVEFDRVITQPGRPVRRQHYSVHYPMLPNKVLVGTGSASTTVPSTTARTTPPTTRAKVTVPRTPTTLRKPPGPTTTISRHT